MSTRGFLAALAALVVLVALSGAPEGLFAEELGENTLEAPVPSIMAAGEEGDAERFERWVDARRRNARAGKAELVRIPVTFRSAAWGSPCPAAYLGVDPDGHAGGPWLALTWADGVEAPEVDPETGLVVLVEGTFTGEQRTEDLRGAPDGPKEFVYTLDVIEVRAVLPYTPPDDDEAPRAEVLGATP